MTTTDLRQGMNPDSDPMRREQLKPGPPPPVPPDNPFLTLPITCPDCGQPATVRCHGTGEHGQRVPFACPRIGVFGEAEQPPPPAPPALPPEVEEAYKELHTAPDGCYSTGPNTGNRIQDLVACPGCAAIRALRSHIATLTREREALRADCERMRAERDEARAFPTRILENNAKIEMLRWVLRQEFNGEISRAAIKAEIAWLEGRAL